MGIHIEELREDLSVMTVDYTVTWTAVISADSHHEAAKLALEMLRDAESPAKVFEVEEDCECNSTVVEVDLTDFERSSICT